MLQFSDDAEERTALEMQSILAVFQQHDTQAGGAMARSDIVTLLDSLNPRIATQDLEGLLASQWAPDAVSYTDFVAWLCR